MRTSLIPSSHSTSWPPDFAFLGSSESIESSRAAVPCAVICEIPAPSEGDPMFHMEDNAIAPHKARFEHARRQLPHAHRRAHLAALDHLHDQATDAADQAGWDTGPIVIGHRKGEAYLGIDVGKAGDRVFDQEYGTPGVAPNPVLRTAITAAKPRANVIYSHHLWRGLGL